MRSVLRLLSAAGLLLACLACTKPEPPDKDQPPEPQAAADAPATDG